MDHCQLIEAALANQQAGKDLEQKRDNAHLRDNSIAVFVSMVISGPNRTPLAGAILCSGHWHSCLLRHGL